MLPSVSSATAAETAGRCRGQQHHLPLLAVGLLHDLACKVLALLPVRRCRPAIIEDQQQRPAAGEPWRRVQDRAGKGQDQDRGQRQPQQQEPPRRAGRRALAALEAQEEEQSREGDPPRGWRRDPQKEPQRRQRQEREQQPRLGEADQAKVKHRAGSAQSPGC
jgi:hypothetical protein